MSERTPYGLPWELLAAFKAERSRSPWTKFDPEDEGTWPEDGQRVMYWFDPLDQGSAHIGIFYKGATQGESGYRGISGFCDAYDAEWWRPLTPLDRPPVEQEKQNET